MDSFATHKKDNSTCSSSIFSDGWMAMEKPVIKPKIDDNLCSSVGGMQISYCNLFESYAVKEDTMQPAMEPISDGTESSGTSSRTSSLGTMASSPSFSTNNNDMDDHAMGTTTAKSRILSRRHARNGAFTFKENGEYELMMHVQRGLPKDYYCKRSQVESANLILSTVDRYCLEEQWMYHIGQEKGETLKSFLADCIAQHRANHKETADQQQPPPPPLIIVDVGTYCGYSAILLAKSVRELAPDLDFHVYTTEVNTQNIMVASSMILMSKFQKNITVLPFQPSVETLSGLLKKKGISSHIDFLFLDHAKDMYLEDLQELERTGLVKKGTHAAADNVVFNRLDGYRNHVFRLQKKGITKTRLAEMSLEYSDDIKDGIEISFAGSGRLSRKAT
eukprot:scaffold12720_cov152-Cylindrotheca_fusiformis.AAC.6